jgi:HSP20 family protein
VERSYGPFGRSFTLSTAVDADKIRASYKSGVLTITLPKAEAAKPKRIQIAASAS